MQKLRVSSDKGKKAVEKGSWQQGHRLAFRSRKTDQGLVASTEGRSRKYRNNTCTALCDIIN